MTEQQWRQRWDAQRMFVTADGETGKAGGNETIRVDEVGQLRIKTPAALAASLASTSRSRPRCGFTTVVTSGRRGSRRAKRCATTSATTPTGTAGIWTPPGPRPPKRPPDRRTARRTGGGGRSQRRPPRLLRAGCVGQSGRGPHDDPGAPAGLAASRRDGRVRAAITALLDHAQQALHRDGGGEPGLRRRPRDGARDHGSRCARETAAPHHRRYPHPAIPYPTHRDGGAARRRGHRGGRGIHQQMGNQHWTTPLRQQTSDPATVDSPFTARRPRSADVASDWRSGDGRQDPAADSGLPRTHHRPGPIVTAATVAGAAVPADRHTHHEACRFPGKHPPPAANTVRAAQDSLLLTN